MLKLVPPLPEVTQKPIQPPSGGCVLKRQAVAAVARQAVQPPSGGCVLKPDLRRREFLDLTQPPSGGCVLKLSHQLRSNLHDRTSRLQAAVC